MSMQISDGFDWLVTLEELSSGKRKCDALESRELSDRASQWPTCACGQLCSILPRTTDQSPVDQQLSNWGYRFYVKVHSRHWCEALELFRKIERRSAHLIKKQLQAEAEEATECILS